ncbi:MAG: HdeD family acid-resistance protein [Alphaproteobacteria bacterium]
MQTTPEQTATPLGRPMLNALADRWWLLLLRGIAAIVFGVLAFIWPGITLITLVLLYGAFALIDGIIALAAAFSGAAKPVPTWWLVVVGLLGIAAGIVVFLWTGISAIVLVMFIGAWAVAHGIFEIIGAIRLRKEIDNEWALILSGIISVLFGAILLIAPGPGALGLIWAIALYSIVFGILFIVFSLRLRRHRHNTASPAAT